jgi:hypothetical protein
MPWIFFTSPLTCRTERLTRVTATDDVGSFDFLPVNFFDVAMVDHLRPMLAEDLASVRVDF